MAEGTYAILQTKFTQRGRASTLKEHRQITEGKTAKMGSKGLIIIGDTDIWMSGHHRTRHISDA